MPRLGGKRIRAKGRRTYLRILWIYVWIWRYNVLWDECQRSDPAIRSASLQRISCLPWLLAVVFGLPTGAIFLYCMMAYQFAPVSLTGGKQASEETV